MMQQPKPKIGVLIEEHFDPSEFRRFNEYFPTQGFEVEYLSHLWGNDSLTFTSNPTDGVIEESVTVHTDVQEVSPQDYVAVILIGGYAMDRLRYQAEIVPGQPNQAPAVQFLRKCVASKDLKIGTICHSLWLFCADQRLIAGRKVTCAHNVVCDVANAGGLVQYDGNQTQEMVIDGNLITGKHPGMVDRFMETIIQEIEQMVAVSS
ncbi:General stress protein 18 [Roseimaritima multifibrata]|uniref:General stress protein 18 n=1 Tax=Roseimaritima multifibrata TaxID=1930274 RepID=A0A517MHV4_9BACT|nr:DJ-1/PfpI family protein [Roseimaritima multifibrata]QDS94460.1 General stress protein 18 [Roseimaritima multifibrata]